MWPRVMKYRLWTRMQWLWRYERCGCIAAFMAIWFLTLSSEVSTRVTFSSLIWRRVCTLYLLLKPLSDGIRILFHNVSDPSKLYCARVIVRCFKSECDSLVERITYRSRVQPSLSVKHLPAFQRAKEIYISLGEESAKFAFEKWLCVA